MLRGSSMPELRERGAVMQRKHAIDQEVREVKLRLAEARTEVATRGTYMDPSQYRDLERKQEGLKLESQALQARLGELRKAEKEANRQSHDAENERFRQAARRLLDPETYQAIAAAAEGIAEEDEDA